MKQEHTLDIVGIVDERLHEGVLSGTMYFIGRIAMAEQVIFILYSERAELVVHHDRIYQTFTKIRETYFYEAKGCWDGEDWRPEMRIIVKMISKLVQLFYVCKISESIRV